jgi:hypothetical protein
MTRQIFAVTSSVFSRMLVSGKRESTEQRIEVGEAPPGAVEALAKFTYTGALESEGDEVIQVLMLADRYDIQPLACACVQRILPRLNADNVVDVVRAARPLSEKKDFASLWLNICNKVRNDAELHGVVMKWL